MTTLLVVTGLLAEAEIAAWQGDENPQDDLSILAVELAAG